jgi:protein-S-isoprenylcysteine O-methyltransferase Ste14
MMDTFPLFQDRLIATIFFVIVAIINKLVYDRKNHSYIKTKTKTLNSFRSFRYLHKILRISTLIIFIGSIWTDNTIWIKLFSGTTFLYFGIAITSLAIVLFLIAGINLGDNYTPCYDSYLPEDIIQNGLYKLIRHPIYTSNLLLIFGVFISCGSALILLNFCILFIYYLMAALSEEKALLTHFPNYKNYKKQTGMFLPIRWQLKSK